MPDQESIHTDSYDDSQPLELRNKIQEEYRTHPTPWFQWVFQQIPFSATMRCLELGTGSGQFWQENQAQISPQWELTLSDSSFEMLAKAKEHLKARKPPLPLAVIDAQSLPFPAESLDLILAIGIFDGVEHPQQALRQSWRILKPGGMLICSAGGQQHLKEMEELLKRNLPDAELGGEPDRFGLENGKTRLQAIFEHVEQRNYDDRLVFSSPHPILEYVRSESQVRQQLQGECLAEFTRDVQIRLEMEGELRVTVQKGIFLARK